MVVQGFEFRITVGSFLLAAEFFLLTLLFGRGVFCLQFEFSYLQFEFFCLFFAYSGKVSLRSTSTDCKQRTQL